MKKLLAILMVFALVLPLCIGVTAAETKAEKKPFLMVNTEDVGVTFDNLTYKILFWSGTSEKYVSEDYLKVDAMNGVGGKTPKEVAENLKPVFDEFPEGARYLRLMSFRSALVGLLEDHIFMEKGLKLWTDWFNEFIQHYHSIGGKLDGVVVDVEFFDSFSYGLTQERKKDPYVYKQIVDNPNYATKIRPQLEERGFKFYPNVTDITPEIYSIDGSSGDQYAQSRAIWNIVIRNHYNQYVTEAFAGATEYYPDLKISDYVARTMHAWDKNMSSSDGFPTGGNYYTAGNSNYVNTYGSRPSPSYFKDNGIPLYQNPPAYNDAVWEDNPYNMTLWELICAKQLKESAPDKRLTVTTVYYNYSTRAGSYCNTPYYSEIMYHTGMLDPDPFQAYCIKSEMLHSGADVEVAMGILSKQLDELTRVAGYADREYIDIPYSWNDKYLLSGMYAGGRNIWRISPDTYGTNTTLESFKVEGAKDPTFTIEGQTVTFPGGKIIEDAAIPLVGTCGYWVETDKDVMPVKTYAKDRYQKYPAFVETYEFYKANADLDVGQANPTGCWSMKKSKDSAAKIVEIGNGKALALAGTYSLKLSDILKNITAGDTYAENQVWELDVTLPNNLPTDAEVVLLDIYGNKAKAEDGGFKIAGGKVYYDNAGTYVELSGVDVSQGGKFKLQRTVDFNNKDAYISTYAVYDANGKRLGEAKNFPMAQVSMPVGKIGLSITNVVGTSVVLDNLKLYVNGVGADLEIYDAKTGMLQEEPDKARDKSTAYRFSWMNATASEKVYTIVAAYYNGNQLVEEKVIETIKMVPGSDGVNTGIVEVAAGQSVKIYARNDSQPDTDSNGGGNQNPANTSENETGLMIAIIACCVVFIALAGVLVVLLNKRKNLPKANNNE